MFDRQEDIRATETACKKIRAAGVRHHWHLAKSRASYIEGFYLTSGSPKGRIKELVQRRSESKDANHAINLSAAIWREIMGIKNA